MAYAKGYKEQGEDDEKESAATCGIRVILISDREGVRNENIDEGTLCGKGYAGFGFA